MIFNKKRGRKSNREKEVEGVFALIWLVVNLLFVLPIKLIFRLLVWIYNKIKRLVKKDVG
jgi:hypothetical protein